MRSFLLFAIILLACHCANKKDNPQVLRVSLWANEDHYYYKAFSHFAELVESRSKGRLIVEVYPSEQLAKEIETIRLIQAEVIDMTVTGSLLSNWIDIAAFCEMPFLLQDSTDKQLLIEGEIGKRINDDMVNHVGLIPLGIFERGPRHLSSNRPIKHPDDLKGLIIRVPNVPSFVTAWSAMGAKPTPMAFSEVFTSLQQGTVEAQENPLALILSAGFAEVQKYINLTEHVISWGYPVIGKKQFESLPQDLQDIVIQSAHDMEIYEKQLFIETEDRIKKELENRGVQFIEVDKIAFAKKCEEAIYQSLIPEMQMVYKGFMESKENKK